MLVFLGCGHETIESHMEEKGNYLLRKNSEDVSASQASQCKLIDHVNANSPHGCWKETPNEH